MPWCPRCRSEYREGFTTCSECNSDLVEKLEEEKAEKNIYDHEVYLTTVSNNIEADVLESLLNSYKIPLLRKYREAGGYLSLYMGNVTSDIDIFVPSKLFDVAKELIQVKAEGEYEANSENNNRDEDKELEEELEEVKSVQRKRTFRAWVTLLFLFPGLFFIVLSVIKLIWEKLFG